jgi:hypothetical protein
MAAFNESALLHSRQLVREAAFIPTHYPGQFLLAHLPFPNRGQTRQNSEFRTGECGCLRDVPTDATQHIFAHTSERVPHTEFAWGQQFGGHGF